MTEGVTDKDKSCEMEKEKVENNTSSE